MASFESIHTKDSVNKTRNLAEQHATDEPVTQKIHDNDQSDKKSAENCVYSLSNVQVVSNIYSNVDGQSSYKKAQNKEGKAKQNIDYEKAKKIYGGPKVVTDDDK